jgi:hypothetical protein
MAGAALQIESPPSLKENPKVEAFSNRTELISKGKYVEFTNMVLNMRVFFLKKRFKERGESQCLNAFIQSLIQFL